MKYIVSTILSIVFFLVQLHAQYAVTAALDSTSILLGDQVQLHFHITQPAGANYQVPDFKKQFDTLNFVEIIEITPVKNPKATSVKQSVTLTSFENGNHQIPSVNFSTKVGNKNYSAISNPVYLEVRSVAGVDTTQQIRPIKDIMEEPIRVSDWIHWVWIGLGIVLGVFIILFIIRKLSKRKQGEQDDVEEIKEIIPAHILAFRQLETLKSRELWQKGKVKIYYSEISHIAREYLENRYEFNALESVTDEIASAMKQRDIAPHLQEDLLTVLRRSDMVKFAKVEPNMEYHDVSLQTLQQFVEQTKFIPPVETPTDKV